MHSSEYNDPYKLAQPTFADVKIGVTPHAKEIETAAEDDVVSNAPGFFRPEQPITREEAAEIYVKAFKIPASSSNALAGFGDAASITPSRRASVNALVAAGYMGGSSATQFSPSATLTAGEARTILGNITTQRVAPPQVLPKPGTTAPRRYVTISTPTPGAKLYYTYTFDGTEPADPSTAAGHRVRLRQQRRAAVRQSAHVDHRLPPLPPEGRGEEGRHGGQHRPELHLEHRPAPHRSVPGPAGACRNRHLADGLEDQQPGRVLPGVCLLHRGLDPWTRLRRRRVRVRSRQPEGLHRHAGDQALRHRRRTQPFRPRRADLQLHVGRRHLARVGDREGGHHRVEPRRLQGRRCGLRWRSATATSSTSAMPRSRPTCSRVTPTA